MTASDRVNREIFPPFNLVIIWGKIKGYEAGGNSTIVLAVFNHINIRCEWKRKAEKPSLADKAKIIEESHKPGLGHVKTLRKKSIRDLKDFPKNMLKTSPGVVYIRLTGVSRVFTALRKRIFLQRRQTWWGRKPQWPRQDCAETRALRIRIWRLTKTRNQTANEESSFYALDLSFGRNQQTSFSATDVTPSQNQ